MSDQTNKRRFSPLDLIEWIGNKLPDPAFLFVGGAVIVMIISAVAQSQNWQVQPKKAVVVTQSVVDDATGELVDRPVLNEDGNQQIELVNDDSVNDGQSLTAKSLLSSDGLYWALKTMVTNFTGFAPLGVVLTGMLGIGVAEKTGFIGALLKAFMLVVPRFLLTPTMVFLGIMSSMGLDAGYIVLPPLAAALYMSVGRSPLAGIAAVFAGVAAGFNANLFVTGLDPMLAEFTLTGARVIDPNYAVAATCNWWFMIASTFVITLAGWATTAWFVEPRMNRKSADEGGPTPGSTSDLASQKLGRDEFRGLMIAVGFVVVLLAIVVGLTFVEDSFLYGKDGLFPRWVRTIVPIIFIAFLVPGVVYGVVLKKIRNSKDLAQLMVDAMANMAPIIVLAFFAAQFIAYFGYSGLDRMLAYAGGSFLAGQQMSPIALMLSFVVLTMFFNLFIGSMSAKYAMFAPIFVPMFMLAAGVSPELTQAAYRIGDSVSNSITPLNAYLIIILVFMQKYASKSGMGSLISMMLPYSIVFLFVWSILLFVWMQFEIPLGPGGTGPLQYIPSAG